MECEGGMNSGALSLAATDITGVSQFLAKLAADLTAAQTRVDEEVKRLAGEADKSTELFK